MLVRRPGSVQDPTLEPRVPARIVAADLRGSVTLLTFESLAPFRFEAGQYVALHHPQGDVPMSLASAPRRLPYFELHYRPIAGTVEAARMDQLLAGTDVGRRSLAARSGEDHGSGTTPHPSRANESTSSGRWATSRHGTRRRSSSRGERAPRRRPAFWSGCGTSMNRRRPHCGGAWRRRPTSTRMATSSPWRVRTGSTTGPLSTGLRARTHCCRRFAEAPLPEDIVLSGPPGFVQAVAATLGRLGVDRARMRSDMFAFE